MPMRSHPAFPIHPKSQILGAEFVGMTKRELIATAIYAEMIVGAPKGASINEPAQLAVMYADALLVALGGA